jgi:DNA-binding transcriptional LysR family regulator
MEIFCTVVETEKMAIAAEKLGMTPPAVSKAIKELEGSLNTQLLIRTTRSMSLTVEGKTYYQNAKSILNDFNQLNQMFHSSSKSLKGKLKIVAPTSFGMTNMQDVIGDYLKLYPEIEIHIDFEDKISALQEKGYDLAVRISEKIEDTSLKGKQFASFSHHLFVHKKLVRMYGEPNVVEELARFPCMAFAYHKTPNVWRLKDGNTGMTHVFNPILTANNSYFLLDQVKKGSGVALLPSFLNDEINKDENLVELLPKLKKPVAIGWVLFVRSGHRRLVERSFCDLLVKRFSI